jgi:hypothetical protein
MCKAQVFSRASERVTSVTGRGKTAKPTTLLIGKDEGAAGVCEFAMLRTEKKAGGLNRSSSLIFRKVELRSHRLKWGQEDFMGRTVFRRTSRLLEVGLVVPSHLRGSGLGYRFAGLPESG